MVEGSLFLSYKTAKNDSYYGQLVFSATVNGMNLFKVWYGNVRKTLGHTRAKA